MKRELICRIRDRRKKTEKSGGGQVREVLKCREVLKVGEVLNCGPHLKKIPVWTWIVFLFVFRSFAKVLIDNFKHVYRVIINLFGLHGQTFQKYFFTIYEQRILRHGTGIFWWSNYQSAQEYPLCCLSILSFYVHKWTLWNKQKCHSYPEHLFWSIRKVTWILLYRCVYELNMHEQFIFVSKHYFSDLCSSGHQNVT